MNTVGMLGFKKELDELVNSGYYTCKIWDPDTRPITYSHSRGKFFDKEEFIKDPKMAKEIEDNENVLFNERQIIYFYFKSGAIDHLYIEGIKNRYVSPFFTMDNKHHQIIINSLYNDFLTWNRDNLITQLI